MQRSLRFNITSDTEDGLKAEVGKVSDATSTLDGVELSAGWGIYSNGDEYLTRLYINKSNKTTWDEVRSAIDNAIGYRRYIFV